MKGCSIYESVRTCMKHTAPDAEAAAAAAALASPEAAADDAEAAAVAAEDAAAAALVAPLMRRPQQRLRWPCLPLTLWRTPRQMLSRLDEGLPQSWVGPPWHSFARILPTIRTKAQTIDSIAYDNDDVFHA